MTAASRSRACHRAVVSVSRWADWYTRDLDPRRAADRRDELASDLWEQTSAADAAGTGGRATALSIRWRAVRGVPADLSWRRSVRGRGDSVRPGLFRRWERSGLLLAAAASGLVTAAAGTVVGWRLVVAADRGQYIPGPTVTTVLLLATLAALLGVALLVQERTRWIGSLWIAAAAAAVLTNLDPALRYTSATFRQLLFTSNALGGDPYTTRWGSALGVVIPLVAVLLALFHVSLAAAWAPFLWRRPAAAAGLDGSRP